MINGCPLLKPEIHFEKQSRDLRNRRERKVYVLWKKDLWYRQSKSTTQDRRQMLEKFWNFNTVELPLMATSPQRPLFCPGGRTVHTLVHKPLYSSAIEERPHFTCQNNLSRTASFFQRLTRKSRMVIKFDMHSMLMINHGNRILIALHLYYCSG